MIVPAVHRRSRFFVMRIVRLLPDSPVMIICSLFSRIKVGSIHLYVGEILSSLSIGGGYTRNRTEMQGDALLRQYPVSLDKAAAAGKEKCETGY